MKAQKGETHYAEVDRATEGDNMEYWTDTACGLKEFEGDMSDNIEHVTCKNCLKRFKIKKQTK